MEQQFGDCHNTLKLDRKSAPVTIASCRTVIINKWFPYIYVYMYTTHMYMTYMVSICRCAARAGGAPQAPGSCWEKAWMREPRAARVGTGIGRGGQMGFHPPHRYRQLGGDQHHHRHKTRHDAQAKERGKDLVLNSKGGQMGIHQHRHRGRSTSTSSPHPDKQ